MRPDDMLETFSELAVKEPDLMRLVLQASVAATVNVQSIEAVDAELRRRAVVFRSAFKKRRCLVIADGFYEWRQSDKQPYFISLASGEQMEFAGLWEIWKSPDELVETCTICTTDAVDMMSQLHNRMPIILPHTVIDHGLDTSVTDPNELKPMLLQLLGEELQPWPVSKAVGNARNQGPQLMEPIDAE